VDDNPAVRYYLREILEQQNTWSVTDEARTGKEALQRIQANQPDVILLDFQMPDMNGIDSAREIGKLFPQIPILMVTIHTNKQLNEEAMKVGIRGVCAKSDGHSIVAGVESLLHEKTYFQQTSSTRA